jgi:chemotaxis protein CheX
MSDERISRDELMHLVQSVWTSMLGLPATIDAGDRVVCHHHQLVGTIQIAGAWNGLVLFLPTEPFVRRATSMMLGTMSSHVSMAEMEDALAELCNVLGGGVKNMLPGPSTLALPMVLHGSNYAVRLPRSRPLIRLRFSCENQPLELRVLEQHVPQPAAAAQGAV